MLFWVFLRRQIVNLTPGKYPKEHTRVGTLIVATIYLQLIQNRYMFRSFTVLQCTRSHQHCVQPVASDVEVPLAAPVVLIVRMERSTA